MQVHQIWIGGTMPTKEAFYAEGIRKAAEAAGWSYKLWDWPSLRAAFALDPAFPALARAIEWLPTATSYSIASDYFRYRVLAHQPGLYIDTDVELRIGEPWPSFPTGSDVFVQTERWAPDNKLAASYILYARRRRPFRLLVAAAERQLLSTLRPDEPGFELRYVEAAQGWGALSLLGPKFLRETALPLWAEQGVSFSYFSKDFAGHHSWPTRALFSHNASGSWVVDKDKREGYWRFQRERAAAASRAAAFPRREARVQLPPQVAASCGRALVRAAAPFSPAFQKHPGELYFRIPSFVKRVVVLSNVTQGFSPDMVPLAAGDLVIHCNLARNAAQAMRVPGTTHWLFCRSGIDNNMKVWYTPQNFANFQKIFFVQKRIIRKTFRFYKEWEAITDSSPTTGFIIANMVRELVPHIPLILAGFDPGVHHGTPIWPGHDWSHEAQWYKDRNFFLIKPQ